MHVSKSILNKQLHYLHSTKVNANLKPSDEFFYRHIGNDPKNTAVILKRLGVSSIDELMDQTVPANIRLSKDKILTHEGKHIEGIQSETLMLSHFKDLAAANKLNKSYQGCGYYPV